MKNGAPAAKDWVCQPIPAVGRTILQILQARERAEISRDGMMQWLGEESKM